MTPYRFAFLLVAARCAILAAAFRLICFPLYGWPTGRLDLLFLAASLALTPVFEGLVAAAWLSSARSARGGRSLTLAIGAGPVALFLLVEGASWWLRAHGQGFLQASMLWSAVRGISTLAPWLGRVEAAAIAALAAAAIAAGLLLTRIAPPCSRRQAWRLLAAAGAALAPLVGTARLGPRRFLNTRGASLSEAIVKANLLPSVTLVWRSVVFPDAVVPPVAAQGLPVRAAPGHPDPRSDPPNFLLVSIESFRSGEEAATVDGAPVMPVLSRLAAEGARFTRAYAASNESAISLVATLTSRDALQYPMRETNRWAGVPVIYDVLAPAYAMGFFSSSNESWQGMKAVSYSPLLSRFFDAAAAPEAAVLGSAADTGFRDARRRGVLQTGSLDDAVTAAALLRWLDDSRPRPGKPFFAFVNFQASHYPYEQGLAVPERFAPAALSDADLSECSFYFYPPRLAGRMRRRYWNSLAYADALLGRVIESLRQRGLLDHTIIIVFGDHGELFGENGAVTHGGHLQEGALRAPLVVWGVPLWAGRAFPRPASLLDIAPMVVELAGAPPFASFQGEPPAEAKPARAPRPIFATAQNAVFEDSVVAGRWRYTRQQDGAYEHLYDVAADPAESMDRSREEPAALECLRATLARFRQEQLGYYARPELAATRFPPAHSLASVPACAAIEER